MTAHAIGVMFSEMGLGVPQTSRRIIQIKFALVKTNFANWFFSDVSDEEFEDDLMCYVRRCVRIKKSHQIGNRVQRIRSGMGFIQ